MRSTDTILYGFSPDQWRRAALNAREALNRNPNDVEAADQLQSALMVVREHATRLGQQAQVQTRADEDEARRVSPAISAAAGAAQGATFNLADEAVGALGAIPRILPGGESPGQAYLRIRDEQRAFNANAEAANPWWYGGGELAGSLPALMGGVAGTRALLPGLARAGQAGALPGATFGTRVGSALARSAELAPSASAVGCGRGEEGPVSDLGGAAVGAGAATVLGFPFMFRANDVIRENAVRAAQELQTMSAARVALVTEGDRIASSGAQARVALATEGDRIASSGAQARVATSTAGPRIETAQNAAAASTYRPAQVRASVAVNEARAAEAATRTRIAAETEGAVVQSRQAAALTGEARVTDIPLNRAMKEDRAFLLAMRRAQMEARRAGEAGAGAVETRFRAGLARMGMTPEAVEQAVVRARATQGSPLYTASAPTVTPPAPAAADATRASPEVMARPVRTTTTQAQQAIVQGGVATRWLSAPPTGTGAASVRALFANMPATEREEALMTFLRTYSGGRIDPGWVPIIRELRALP